MRNITLITVFLLFILKVQSQSISDIDGNVYNTVTIGSQTWMLENLRTTKLNDGVTIPTVTGNIEWTQLNTPAICTYNNTTDADSIRTFGRLYNLYAANSGKLCPTGFHMPSVDDWSTLIKYLGGSAVAGGKLKEVGSKHWNSLNSGADNSSGFTALPGGGRYYGGKFDGIGSLGSWWYYNDSSKWANYICLLSNSNSLYKYGDFKYDGFSARCIMNNASNIGEYKIDDFFIFPNPANDKLYTKNILSVSSQIYIFNLQGEVVLNKINDSNSIDISKLRNGIFIIKIVDSNMVKIAKFLKE